MIAMRMLRRSGRCVSAEKLNRSRPSATVGQLLAGGPSCNRRSAKSARACALRISDRTGRADAGLRRCTERTAAPVEGFWNLPMNFEELRNGPLTGGRQCADTSPYRRVGCSAAPLVRPWDLRRYTPPWRRPSSACSRMGTASYMSLYAKGLHPSNVYRRSVVL